jgi:hypothetical protein
MVIEDYGTEPSDIGLAGAAQRRRYDASLSCQEIDHRDLTGGQFEDRSRVPSSARGSFLFRYGGRL